MLGMEKNKLLLSPFFIGIFFMAYSRCLSYALSIDSLNDSIFNHVHIL